MALRDPAYTSDQLDCNPKLKLALLTLVPRLDLLIFMPPSLMCRKFMGSKSFQIFMLAWNRDEPAFVVYF